MTKILKKTDLSDEHVEANIHDQETSTYVVEYFVYLGRSVPWDG